MRTTNGLVLVLAAGCAGQGSEEIGSALAQCEDLTAEVCEAGTPIVARASEATAIRIDSGVTYEVAPPGPGQRGYVSFVPFATGTYTVFSSDDPIRFCDLQPSCRSTELACPNLDRAARYDMVAGELYVIELQPESTTIRIEAPESPFELPFEAIRSYPAGSAPRELSLGDLDNDGDRDLVVSSPDDANGLVTIDLLRNDGGDFTLVGQVGTSVPAETAVADFNGDGNLDVTNVAWDGQGPLPGSYLVGDGAFGFTREPGPRGFDFRGDLHAADFDEDGTPELVASFYDNTVPQGPGPGGFVILDVPAFTPTQNEPAFGVATTYALAGDFDGDGHQDVLVANDLDGRLRLYRGNGSGLVAFDSEHTVPGIGVRKLGRVNDDLITIGRDSTVVVTSPDFSSSQVLPRTMVALDVTAGDLDGDGRDDIVIVGATDDGAGGVAVFYARAGGYELGGTLPMPGTSRGVAIDDVDADGKADIVATSYGAVFVYRGR